MSANFYDNWLTMWKRSEEEKSRARTSISTEELQWFRTKQDYKAALMVAPETGFRTWGGITMGAEIPSSWHTGCHSHGEEAIYFVKGKGFSIIDDKQYDWEEGTCMFIPFGSAHQHFNDGSETAFYVSAMAPHLEYYCGLAKFEQFDDCGENSGAITRTKSTSEYKDSTGRRLVLHQSEMAITVGGEELANSRFAEQQTASMSHLTKKAMYSGDKNKGMSAWRLNMMSSRPDFYGDEVEMTHIIHHSPGAMGGKHGHMEAILYILDGEGYMDVDGKRVPWKKGSSLHVQGPQTLHQPYNTGSVEAKFIRIQFGLRMKLMQPIAKRKFPYVYLADRKPTIPQEAQTP
jgi:mannose-6-phosphate isomerase-like protein (cupin superfamily)